jgi:hypothetical protein
VCVDVLDLRRMRKTEVKGIGTKVFAREKSGDEVKSKEGQWS